MSLGSGKLISVGGAKTNSPIERNASNSISRFCLSIFSFGLARTSEYSLTIASLNRGYKLSNADSITSEGMEV